MKNSIFIIFTICFSIKHYSQVEAYEATYTNYALAPCIDLTLMDHLVKGHQLDYEVDYFLTIDEAEANTNPVNKMFFSYASFDQILFSRVTSNTQVSDYEITRVFLNLENLPCCPPPPPGLYGYYICDTDNDGFSTAYLSNLRKQHGYGFPEDSFCNLNQGQVIITYYTSEADAIAGINEVPEIYTFSEATVIWFKYSNTGNNDYYISRFNLDIETCDGLDTDGDGINDMDEDVNRNGSIEDDDTDLDGLKNYEDNDDDGDSILTINEDYNLNGTALDDDTNSNGIPDYLEPSVTLFVANQVSPVIFNIVENPVKNNLLLRFQNDYEQRLVIIYNMLGEIVHQSQVDGSAVKIDVSFLPSSMYFLSIKDQGKSTLNKIIKE